MDAHDVLTPQEIVEASCTRQAHKPSWSPSVDRLCSSTGSSPEQGTRYKWLDVMALAAHLLPKDEIHRVRYFTAKVSGRPDDPQQPVRQETYLRALLTLPGVTVHLGEFRVGKPRMRLATPRPDGPSTHRVSSIPTRLTSGVVLLRRRSSSSYESLPCVRASSARGSMTPKADGSPSRQRGSPASTQRPRALGAGASHSPTEADEGICSHSTSPRRLYTESGSAEWSGQLCSGGH